MKLKNVVIFIWKMLRLMLRLSFHGPGKMSHKLPKMVKEICVQGRKTVRKHLFRFVVGTPVENITFYTHLLGLLFILKG